MGQAGRWCLCFPLSMLCPRMKIVQRASEIALQCLQGWVNDVTLLRKQIAAVDRKLKQMRVCGRLPDDERRDQILDRHYR